MEHNWETIIAAAKRENNSRRSFVLVNRLQGKHVPASPSQAMEMFRQLADALKQRYPSEPCLAIGFAETATAIGLAVAQACQYASMTTTREPLPDVSYLFFSEAHSHATEQKLVQDDLDSITGQIKRIVFVEDEVTTGRTILQIVQLLRKQYGADRFSFTAASLLNGMGETEQAVYAREQIDCVFLHKTMPELYDDLLAQYTQLGAAHSLPQAHGLTAPVFCFDGRLELLAAAAAPANSAAMHSLVGICAAADCCAAAGADSGFGHGGIYVSGAGHRAAAGAGGMPGLVPCHHPQPHCSHQAAGLSFAGAMAAMQLIRCPADNLFVRAEQL